MTITYKCHACGSAMEFDGPTQTLKCDHCGFSISVEEYEKQYNNEGETKENQENQSSDNNLKIYHCQSCGAELITDEFTSATICGFCGNPSLVEDRLSGEFSPSLVIPFKIDKENAKIIYQKWIKKGPLTPRTLASKSTIEKITGLYTPFWLYDYQSSDYMEAAATRTRMERRGEYEYIYTDHYSIYREVNANFVQIPADASEKMPDDSMDKLEPFDYKEMTEFKMPYLSGFLAEKYNYTSEELEKRARARADQYITDITRGTINGYTTVNVLRNEVSANNTHNDYALFPVWMLNYKFKGKDYQFMLNGQTGKIVADRPISTKRALAWFGIITVGTFIITMIGGLFIS